ncbi:MAG TPA: ABC transporter ATP-binding protein [Kiritimatiellia bacterium]|nr:ABC transporter ATP-binding protein [Kiritimatiellia bacterium]HPS08624.1 ABC transporter ATP-binding protein [Kiritimatiellia bacterium]
MRRSAVTRRLSILPATLLRAVRLVWLSDRRLAFWHTVLTAIQALLPLGTLFALKQVIDIASRLFQNSERFSPFSFSTAAERFASDADFRQLTAWAFFGALCLVLVAVARLLITWVAEFHSLAVSDRVYDLLHDTLLRADYAFFENPDDQNRLYMAREEALSRPARVLAGFGQILYSLVGLVGVLFILASFSPWLPFCLAFAALPVFFFKLDRTRRFYEWRKSLTPLERQAAYFHSVMTDDAGAKEIRLYGHGGFCRTRFAGARAKLREERVAWRRYVLSREAAGLFLGLLITGLILLWMTGRLLAGAVTVGSLVLCVQAVQRGQNAVTSLLNAVAALFEDALFLQSFEELLRLPTRVLTPANTKGVPDPIAHGITFEQVSFAYPGASGAVLRDLSFTLRPGERVVLAGANGAGKSTLVKLLCRLYDPDQGRILVDGIDLRELDPAAWRSRIGAVFQDFNHYQLSAAENIWIGHTRLPPDSPAVERAAADAGMKPLLAAWPQGLKTLLGRWLHDGIEPSIGQWQKIAIARAFVRPALLYILDEPASALDSTAQRETFEALARLSRGKIALFTSHRDLGPGMADRLLVLEGGAIAADRPL